MPSESILTFPTPILTFLLFIDKLIIHFLRMIQSMKIGSLLIIIEPNDRTILHIRSHFFNRIQVVLLYRCCPLSLGKNSIPLFEFFIG